MQNLSERDFLLQVLRGDQYAVAFCETLFSLSQVLDDLVDGDKPVGSTTVVNSFWDALIELPANPFYRMHEQYLRPQMAVALQDWRDSMVLERQPDVHARTLAFVMRDQLTGIVSQAAYLVGGRDWMQEVSPQIRLYFHDESLSDYLTSLMPEVPATDLDLVAPSDNTASGEVADKEVQP